jgi:hypothetical protein
VAGARALVRGPRNGPGRRRAQSAFARDVNRLEQVADVGESDETPPILIGGVWVVCAVVVMAILALTLVVARLA